MNVALFGGNQQSNANAAVNAATKKYEKGAVIVEEGSSVAEMYVLTQGSLGVYKSYGKFNQTSLGDVKSGESFGENSMFFDKPQNASLVALSDSTVVTLTAKTVADIFSKQPELAISVIKGLARKLDAATRSAAKPEAPASTQPLSKSSELFPEGHGSYALPLSNNDDTYIFKQQSKCPLCGCSFDALFVLSSRLKREKTDRDLRVHFAGVEPMFYDVVSCPNCLYSAPSDRFPEASVRAAEDVHKEMNRYLTSVEIKTGFDRDTFTVFAGYYLALRCIPICFDQPQMMTAGLWLKLSRIYKDCGDENMYLSSSLQAIQDYEYVYQKLYISEKQSQQICYILGDLYERLKEYDKAKTHFFNAKNNREGTPAMKLQADKRLEEIKELQKG